VDDLSVVPFHCCADAYMCGQVSPNSGPVVMDTMCSQCDWDGMHDMICQAWMLCAVN
jgi:hypothetical protein